MIRSRIAHIFATVLLIQISDVSTNQTQSTDSMVSEPEFLLPQDLALKRCGCAEVQDSECINQDLVIMVVDFEQALQNNFHISDFSNVTIVDLDCPMGLIKVKLSNFVNQIFLLTTDEILWYDMNNYITQEYCIEPVTGGGWGVHICIEPPSIPRCCPEGEVLSSDGDTCTKATSPLPFSPPFLFNNKVMNDVVSHDNRVVNITCSGIEVERILQLDGDESSLTYSSGRALLDYKPPEYLHDIPYAQQFCIAIDGSDASNLKYISKFCYTDPKEDHFHKCRNSVCIKKCCSADSFYLDNNCASLQEWEERWQPIFHEPDTLDPGASAPENLLMDFGLPFCKHYYILDPESDDYEKPYLLTDGRLVHAPAHESISTDKYCLDMTYGANDSFKEIAFVCHPEDTCQWKSVLNVVLLSVSCVFLVATLAVYIGVSDLRDRTNGRCLISMVVATLAAYVSLITNNRVTNPSDINCLLTAFSTHVFVLAMFFWLNVMCYDMWATLRSSQQQHQSKKTFIKYSIYAWGTPLLVGVITMILDRTKPNGIILPNFLEDMNCWFKDDAEYWLYFSSIILILVLANLFFFIHVAITLARKLRQRQSVFDNSNSRTNRSQGKIKQQAWLYVKLFIVMGVVWIADVISSIQHRRTCSFWVVTEIFHSLQGLFIFLVAVCNRDNLKKFNSAWEPRVDTVRSKISTVRGKSTVSNKNKRKTADSLATSEASRKTSVTSLPRKISQVSLPPQYLTNANKEAAKLNESNSLITDDSSKRTDNNPSRKISLASNLEPIPMESME